MRLADRLVRHAGRIAPPDRREWAQAMEAEVAHIAAPYEAAVFAAGCVSAAYGERLRSVTGLAYAAGRGVAVLMAFYAGGVAWMSTRLVLAWSERAGEQPAWPFVAMYVMALAYLCGALAAFRRGPAILTAFALVAMAVNTATLLAVVNTPGDLAGTAQRALHERFYAAIVIEQYVVLILLLTAGLVLDRAPRSAWMRRLAAGWGLRA